jgi:hypothetical protein
MKTLVGIAFGLPVIKVKVIVTKIEKWFPDNN